MRFLGLVKAGPSGGEVNESFLRALSFLHDVRDRSVVRVMILETGIGRAP